MTYRRDIEGLRAVAVLVVVLYHCGIAPFSGGYIGVDVFFVLSGFLITSLMLGEITATSRLSLVGFYARRARRLLPAATLVIAATVFVGWFVLSPLARRDLVGDALNATTFTINWRFASQSTDYFQSELAPSALQHYWSLAVEEQFYLVWPLLISILAGRHVRRRVLTIGLATIIVASFVVCQLVTSQSQPWAFFGLHTRMWQLGLGSLVAVVWTQVERIPPILRRAGPIVGIAAIVYAAIAFDDATSWPGVAALVPSLGALGVIVGSTDAPSTRLLSSPPMVWIGARSYSWYLWHWPALVLFAAWRDQPLDAPVAIVVAVASLAIGHAAYTLIEQPIRRRRSLVHSPRRSLAVGFSLTAACLLGLVILQPTARHVDARGQDATRVEIPTTTPTPVPTTLSNLGASSSAIAAAPASSEMIEMTEGSSNVSPAADVSALVDLLESAASVRDVPANLEPSLADARDDLPDVYQLGCHADIPATQPVTCERGDIDGATTAVLVGDSHAAQWFPALDSLAAASGIRLIPMTKSGCSYADVDIFSSVLNREYTECAQWRDNVFATIRALQPDIVIATQSSTFSPLGAEGDAARQAMSLGFQASLGAFGSSAASVIVLSDTPYPAGDVPDCLSDHLHDAGACTRSRDEAVAGQLTDIEASAAAASGASFVTVSDLVCGPTRCPVIVGDLLVYRDNSHLSTPYVRWLEPALAALLGSPWTGAEP